MQQRTQEQLLSVWIAVVLLAAAAGAVLVDRGGDLDADAAARCAVRIASDLGHEPRGPAAVREHHVRAPDGDTRPVWATSTPAAGFVLEVGIAQDGEVVSARGIAPGGADPLNRDERVRALGMRCQP